MFDLSKLFDPSSYAVSASPTRRNYNYTTLVTFTVPVNGKTDQYITVASNDILTHDQIINTAFSYAIGGRYGVDSEMVDNIEITGATRSSALGE